MSRVAKTPINYSNDVKVSMDNDCLSVKGQNTELNDIIHSDIDVIIQEKVITVRPKQDNKAGWMMAGTMRSIINNMVVGVTQGFVKKLELVGVGYRAQSKGNVITLSLGFSHPIDYKLPQEVSVEVQGNTTVVLKSANKQKLGQVAAEIRAFRPPEPYKGKGVRYSDEIVKRKETKKK
jgi:large subunit ribosomal protein L6